MPTLRSMGRGLIVAATVLLAHGASLAVAQDAGFGPAAKSRPGAATQHQAFLKQYCVTCHNQRLRTQGLALDAVDLDQVVPNAELWEKVIRKLRTGAMPPPGARRPAQGATDNLAAWLEHEIDRAAFV